MILTEFPDAKIKIGAYTDKKEMKIPTSNYPVREQML
jgi:hypothetical protein